MKSILIKFVVVLSMLFSTYANAQIDTATWLKLQSDSAALQASMFNSLSTQNATLVSSNAALTASNSALLASNQALQTRLDSLDTLVKSFQTLYAADTAQREADRAAVVDVRNALNVDNADIRSIEATLTEFINKIKGQIAALEQSVGVATANGQRTAADTQALKVTVDQLAAISTTNTTPQAALVVLLDRIGATIPAAKP